MPDKVRLLYVSRGAAHLHDSVLGFRPSAISSEAPDIENILEIAGVVTAESAFCD